jgi:hypothetical protein
MLFKDPCTKNFIHFIVSGNNKECQIIDYYVDENNSKIFIILMKNSFEQMKKSGCEKLIQTITVSDYDMLYKNDTDVEFVVISRDDSYITISCDIDYAPTHIAKGFLFSDENDQ